METDDQSGLAGETKWVFRLALAQLFWPLWVVAGLLPQADQSGVTILFVVGSPIVVIYGPYAIHRDVGANQDLGGLALNRLFLVWIGLIPLLGPTYYIYLRVTRT